MGNTREREGDNELYLEPGLECDTCNNGPISAIENAFIEKGPGFVFRLLNPKYSELRVHRSILPPNISLPGQPAKPGTRLTRLTFREPKVVSKEDSKAKSNYETFQLTFDLGIHPHITSAFLSKMLIEIIAKMSGRELALHSGLDDHRTNATKCDSLSWLSFLQGRYPAGLWPHIGYRMLPHALIVYFHGFVFCMPITASLVKELELTFVEGHKVRLEWSRAEASVSEG